MPWFITAICSDESLETLRHEIINPEYPRPQRTFGFFNSYEEASKAIKNNTGNMREGLYDYLALEYIEPGIHPKVHKIEWYKWLDASPYSQWISMANKCPKEFSGLVNFALG